MGQPKRCWSITEHSRQVHTITFRPTGKDWEGWLLVQSDEHWDNAHCDLELLRKHHEEAVERDAPIIKIGDALCLMQGRWDKRADQNQLRPEHRGNCYLDRVIDTATQWYAPYAKQIALISPGNHENSVLLRHQTNLSERLVSGLRAYPGSQTCLGGYWGFIAIHFELQRRLRKVLHYHHGYGGGGEVTRGLIDNNRTRGQYEADIYVSGHIHRRNSEENVMTRLSRNAIVRSEQLFLRSGTYKREYEGWHAEGGRAARPIGGWFIRFRCVRQPGGKGHEIEMTEMRAN